MLFHMNTYFLFPYLFIFTFTRRSSILQFAASFLVSLHPFHLSDTFIHVKFLLTLDNYCFNMKDSAFCNTFHELFLCCSKSKKLPKECCQTTEIKQPENLPEI